MANEIEKELNKEKKPKVLYGVSSFVWDAGLISGLMYKNTVYGRQKVKLAYTKGSTFISDISRNFPDVGSKLEPFIFQLESDSGTTTIDGDEKVAKIDIQIYDNGMVDLDCSEILRSGSAGRPRNWRQDIPTFVSHIKAKAGDAVLALKNLPQGGPKTSKKDEDGE